MEGEIWGFQINPLKQNRATISYQNIRVKKTKNISTTKTQHKRLGSGWHLFTETP